MPLSKLQVLNGRPVRFSGFDWDYRGAISDWNGGRLQPDDKAPERRGISLNHRDGADGADGAYPMGGDNSPVKTVVIVGEISIPFPGEDDLKRLRAAQSELEAIAQLHQQLFAVVQ